MPEDLGFIMFMVDNGMAIEEIEAARKVYPHFMEAYEEYIDALDTMLAASVPEPTLFVGSLDDFFNYIQPSRT